jgi:hypothetical protein
LSSTPKILWTGSCEEEEEEEEGTVPKQVAIQERNGEEVEVTVLPGPRCRTWRTAVKNPQLVPAVMGQVSTSSTGPVSTMVTSWMLKAGTNLLDGALELQAVTGAVSAAMRVRYAKANTQRPGTWGVASAAQTTAGVGTARFDLSGVTDQLWVQLGMVLTGAAIGAECFARLQAAAQGNGMVLAQQLVEVEPDTNTGSYTYVGLGKPFAQLGLTKLMYGITFSGVSGSIVYRPVYRQIKGNVDSPENWADQGAGDGTQSVDGDTNSGELVLAPVVTPGFLLGQAGIKYTGAARGTMRIVVAGIY